MPSIEEWRPVVDWEGLYEVSDCGRVRSLERTVVRMRYGKTEYLTVRARVLNPRVKSSGHLEVTLHKSGAGRGHGRIAHIHRLVLESFVGPCPSGMECLHENDIAADNRVVNLSWGTRRENLRDLVRNGRHHNTRKTHCIRGHEFSAENTLVLRRLGQPRRVCRACSRIRLRESRQRQTRVAAA